MIETVEIVGKKKASYFLFPGLNSSTSHHLISEICEHFKVSRNELYSASRSILLVRARSYYFFIERTFVKALSLKDLGREFGRDHSTVIHSLNTFQNDMQTNEIISSDFERFLKKLNVEWYNKYVGYPQPVSNLSEN